jgi:uncharacterized damage-inducible protein DinB
MNVNDIQDLYAYNRWAGRRMFDALEKLDEKQFMSPRASSFPSIWETVFHILAAEWIWLKRWTGASPVAAQPVKGVTFETWKSLRSNGASPPLNLSTVAELRGFCESLDEERQAFLARLSEDQLHAPLNYQDMSGNMFSLPLVQLMQHVVNHGTYHRGQVTTMLREAGAEAVSLDMVYFFRERQEKAAASETGATAPA